VLLDHVVRRPRSFLFGHPEYELSGAERQHWATALRERRGGKPVQYITGRQEFFGLDFEVTPDVLIPRPETELLVEEAIERAGAGQRILDVGTGSGCIALAIRSRRPDCQVVACDYSRAALTVANRNAIRLRTAIGLVETDLAGAFGGATFDFVVSNPPYVPWSSRTELARELHFEPAGALFAGEDGLAIYRRLIPEAERVLRSQGWLLLELGYNTRSAVQAMLPAGSWGAPFVRPDLAGLDRVLAARRR
jgi:release factor glutamine methyltransferase